MDSHYDRSHPSHTTPTYDSSTRQANPPGPRNSSTPREPLVSKRQITQMTQSPRQMHAPRDLKSQRWVEQRRLRQEDSTFYMQYSTPYILLKNEVDEICNRRLPFYWNASHFFQLVCKRDIYHVVASKVLYIGYGIRVRMAIVNFPRSYLPNISDMSPPGSLINSTPWY